MHIAPNPILTCHWAPYWNNIRISIDYDNVRQLPPTSLMENWTLALHLRLQDRVAHRKVIPAQVYIAQI